MADAEKTCDCCGYPASPLHYREYADGSDYQNLCDLCRETSAGRLNEDPHFKRGDMMDLFRTVCYVGNTILEEIQEVERRLGLVIIER
jgi:hypothetical protein